MLCRPFSMPCLMDNKLHCTTPTGKTLVTDWEVLCVLTDLHSQNTAQAQPKLSNSPDRLLSCTHADSSIHGSSMQQQSSTQHSYQACMGASPPAPCSTRGLHITCHA